jgi:hydrogenase maturation factor HypE
MSTNNKKMVNKTFFNDEAMRKVIYPNVQKIYENFKIDEFHSQYTKNNRLQ